MPTKTTRSTSKTNSDIENRIEAHVSDLESELATLEQFVDNLAPDADEDDQDELDAAKDRIKDINKLLGDVQGDLTLDAHGEALERFEWFR